ncbi:MAG: hypothetical protein JXN64_01220 [Spirochaetes bacterium]|nr:hypothetical protein [Spirochaetota bacterium]
MVQTSTTRPFAKIKFLFHMLLLFRSNLLRKFVLKINEIAASPYNSPYKPRRSHTI